MAPIAKLVIAILGFFVSTATAGGDARTRRLELGRALDLFFSIAICAFLAIQLGAFRIEPLEERGYDAIVPLMAALGLLVLKGVLFVLVPAALLCWFLRRFENLTPRLVIYGLFGIAGALAWRFEQQRVAERTLAATRAHEASEAARAQAGREAQSMAQARAQAAKREIEERREARQRLLELRIQARDRWLADIHAASAIGAEGEAPPMIHVVASGPHEVRVTNAAKTRACVKLVRTLVKPGTDIHLRCPADLFRDCVDINRGATVTFHLMFDERSPACRERQFEYRVGTPLKPEPTWWSASALRYIGENPLDMREPPISEETLTVRGEIARLEKMLAETGRAERWRAAR